MMIGENTQKPNLHSALTNILLNFKYLDVMQNHTKLAKMLEAKKVAHLLNEVRYQLEAIYPGSQPLGMIYILGEGELEKEFQKYPHLFRKLEWYEHREDKMLPYFVLNVVSNYPFKVKVWKSDFGRLKAYQFVNDSGVSADWLRPLTPDEYKEAKDKWDEKLKASA